MRRSGVKTQLDRDSPIAAVLRVVAQKQWAGVVASLGSRSGTGRTNKRLFTWVWPCCTTRVSQKALLTSLRAGNLLILAGVEGARRRSAAYSLASTRFGDGACAPATRERSICSAPLILRCRCGEIIWRERSARLRKALPRQDSNWARSIRRCGRRSAGGVPGPAHSQRGEQPRAAGAATGVHLAARHRRAVEDHDGDLWLRLATGPARSR